MKQILENRQLKQETMKTTKAQLNQIILATFLLVFLLSGNVEAEGTEWNVDSGLENVGEPNLEVEDWMVSDRYWLTKENAFLVEAEQEKNLSLEAWMFDKNKWGLAAFDYTSLEVEKGLMLEQWMISEMYWN